jgi:hypothetical protein
MLGTGQMHLWERLSAAIIEVRGRYPIPSGIQHQGSLLSGYNLLMV